MRRCRAAIVVPAVGIALGTLLVLASPRSSRAAPAPAALPTPVSAVANAARPAPVACTKYAAPSGSDGHRGTMTRPFKTVQRLADSLRPGQTGCLRSGVYAETTDGFAVSFERGGRPGAPIRIRSHPGERAMLVGIIQVPQESPHVALSRLVIEGTGDQNTVKIYAADVVVEDSNISNAGRGKSCMILGSTSGNGQAIRTMIRRNRFHDCGSWDHDNKDHAIYVSNALKTQIVGNVFWNTAGYSVHFYPSAQGTRVAHNVIDGGAPSVRGGVLFGGNDEYASSDNVVEQNVIAYAESSNITSGWDEVAGTGNIARRNCVWAGKDRNIDDSEGGFSASGNTVANPHFINRSSRDYRLKRGSRCARVVGFVEAARLRSR